MDSGSRVLSPRTKLDTVDAGVVPSQSPGADLSLKDFVRRARIRRRTRRRGNRTALSRLRGPWPAIMGSSALFLAVHVAIYGQPWVAETLVVGVGCGLVFVRYRSLWPAVFVHWARGSWRPRPSS